MPEKPAKGPSLGARLSESLRRVAEAAAERPETSRETTRGALAARSRRDFLLFGAGIVATATAGWWLVPERAKRTWFPGTADQLDTLAARVGLTRMQREAQLNRVLTFDDDVAEALFSKERRVRTYDRPDARPLRNNYHGRTPGPEYLAGWRLNLSGLASGRSESLGVDELLTRFARHDMNTRLVCVEGWSHVVAWGGLRFADLVAAYPPAPGARWAALRSTVSLNGAGQPEPYYVSLDLETARHPQALLATHHAGAPLTLAHGAPLRLVVPMKLGLKNIKAITDISYTVDEPVDYWNERGYSRYDGV
jgi:molybdopterin-dependent oxidoreductase-like protein protein